MMCFLMFIINNSIKLNELSATFNYFNHKKKIHIILLDSVHYYWYTEKSNVPILITHSPKLYYLSLIEY